MLRPRSFVRARDAIPAVQPRRSFTAPAWARSPRFKAACAHLGVSLALALLLLGGLLYTWYPLPLFPPRRIAILLALVCAAAVLVGPAITLIIRDRRANATKARRWRYASIVLLQTALLGYGAWVGYSERPVFITFHDDEFVVVTASSLHAYRVREAQTLEFRSLSLTGPLLAAVQMPEDINERNRVAFGVNFGEDIAHLPRYYVRYDVSRDETLDAAKPIDDLRTRNPAKQARIDDFLAANGRTEETVRYLPVKAPRGAFAAIVDASTGDFLGILPLTPGDPEQPATSTAWADRVQFE